MHTDFLLPWVATLQSFATTSLSITAPFFSSSFSMVFFFVFLFCFVLCVWFYWIFYIWSQLCKCNWTNPTPSNNSIFFIIFRCSECNIQLVRQNHIFQNPWIFIQINNKISCACLTTSRLSSLYWMFRGTAAVAVAIAAANAVVIIGVAVVSPVSGMFHVLYTS